LININDNIEAFTNIDIYLLIDDTSNKELIENVKQFILSYLTRLNEFNVRLNFYIEQNHKFFREGKIFKLYLIDKLKDYKNELVFFGHTKGRQNIEDGKEINNILKWISLMYCMNLDIGYFEMRNYLIKNTYDKITFGAIYNYTEKCSEMLKYKWMFIGGFCWINIDRLLKYLTDNNIEYNNIFDSLNIYLKTCAETFLPNYIPVKYVSYYNCSLYNMYYSIKDNENHDLSYRDVQKVAEELMDVDTFNKWNDNYNKNLNILYENK
jgi:hypothetical protein